MKVLAGIVMTAACLLAHAAETPHSIEYRILDDKVYVVAKDLNGEMVGISEKAIEDWPTGMSVPGQSHKLYIGSAGGDATESTATVAYSGGCSEVRVETTSQSFETETHIIVVIMIQVYCGDELLDVFVSKVKVPKPEAEEAPEET